MTGRQVVAGSGGNGPSQVAGYHESELSGHAMAWSQNATEVERTAPV